MFLAGLRGLSPEAMILAGVAMSPLFMAGTMLTQYLTEEEELVATACCSFHNLGRPVWIA